jgi:hypothetical protein
MQWSEVTKPPPPKMLRQFAGLFLVVFVGWALWRTWNGQPATWTMVLAGLGIVVAGLVWPPSVRWIYTGWMIAVFPIGWTISWLVLALLFYGVFTPVSLIFKLKRRDALGLRRREAQSFWTAKEQPTDVATYFRQS